MPEHETLAQSEQEQAERNEASAAYRERCKEAQAVYDAAVLSAWDAYDDRQRQIDRKYEKWA